VSVSRPDQKRRRQLAALVLAAAACLILAAPAGARPSLKKSIWGPLTVKGKSQFPIYRDLGVGIYQMGVSFNEVAPFRPKNPDDPASRAYHWPAEIDYAIREARKYGIRVALQVEYSPPWANGGRPYRWAPDPAEFARFLAVAARRYPDVHLWEIWGEPTRTVQFQPLTPERYTGQPLNARQRRGPETYARLLDAAYGALKAVNPRNLVIGGMSFTTGNITPLNWIKHLRLPNGLPPRMDMYGHNPFSARRPNLRRHRLKPALADICDLDDLAKWVDRWLGRPRHHKRIKLFLSEYFLPTDHSNRETNFWVSHKVQADYLADALRIARRWSRIYTLGWIGLYDDPRQANHQEVNRGLLTRSGKRKLSYYAYRRG
jgi:hypothetical protein